MLQSVSTSKSSQSQAQEAVLDTKSWNNLTFKTDRHNPEVLERFGRLEDKQYICCMDLEFTCWDRSLLNQIIRPKREVIEFGIVVLESSTLQECERISVFIRPEENPTLSEYCTRLTGITQKDVDSAPPLRDAWTALSPRLPKPREFVWVSYGRDGDELEDEFKRKGEPIRLTDPRILNVKLSLEQRFGKKLKSLDRTLADAELLPEEPRHRALPDAGSLAALVQKYPLSPTDATVSLAHTYAERLHQKMEEKVSVLTKRERISRDEARALLPLVYWDVARARTVLNTGRRK